MMSRRKYPIEFKREVENRYVYDVIVAYGCVGCWTLLELSNAYRIPIGTLRTWAYRGEWHEKRLLYVKVLVLFEGTTIKIIKSTQGWDPDKWEIVNEIMNQVVEDRILVPLVENRKEIMEGLRGDTMDFTPIFNILKDYFKILDEHLNLENVDLQETTNLLVGGLKNALVEA